MAVMYHPLIIAYEEETRSFPCRLCGHLYYSETELHRHINGFHQEKRRWYSQHCHKEVHKDRNKLLHEGHCLGTRCKYVFTYRNHYSPDRLIYSYLKFIISYAFSYFRTKT